MSTRKQRPSSRSPQAKKPEHGRGPTPGGRMGPSRNRRTPSSDSHIQAASRMRFPEPKRQHLDTLVRGWGLCARAATESPVGKRTLFCARNDHFT